MIFAPSPSVHLLRFWKPGNTVPARRPSTQTSGGRVVAAASLGGARAHERRELFLHSALHIASDAPSVSDREYQRVAAMAYRQSLSMITQDAHRHRHRHRWRARPRKGIVAPRESQAHVHSSPRSQAPRHQQTSLPRFTLLAVIAQHTIRVLSLLLLLSTVMRAPWRRSGPSAHNGFDRARSPRGGWRLGVLTHSASCWW